LIATILVGVEKASRWRGLFFCAILSVSHNKGRSTMLAIDDIVEQVRAEQGWSADAAEGHRRAYIAFLSNPATRGRPDVAVDAIWHAHILWTRRYRQDCEALVGHFIDHEPDPLVRDRCTAPEQPDDIAAGKARCTAPDEQPPPTGSARCTPSPEPDAQRAARCTPSDPPPDIGAEPVSRRRMAYATGS
jgi:hypothetical protein